MREVLNELNDAPPSDPTKLDIQVEYLNPTENQGRLLALARVRIISPSLTVACGPWRVVSREGMGESVIPPDVREGGRWVPAISLPRPVLAMVEDAVLAAYQGQVEGASDEQL